MIEFFKMEEFDAYKAYFIEAEKYAIVDEKVEETIHKINTAFKSMDAALLEMGGELAHQRVMFDVTEECRTRIDRLVHNVLHEYKDINTNGDPIDLVLELKKKWDNPMEFSDPVSRVPNILENILRNYQNSCAEIGLGTIVDSSAIKNKDH